MNFLTARLRSFCFVFLCLGRVVSAEEVKNFPLTVPEGYTVELAAAAPLVRHPMMADFDERGRLYVAASAGENLQRPELEARLPNFIQRLEDTDGDGRFDTSTVFADRMTFPQGCLWRQGSLYVASSGAIWKLTDTDDDGVADQRVKLVGDFGYTGNAADIHGPFAGPDGRIYWCDGRHGHEIQDAAGNPVSRGKAARIFSCRDDGTDVQTFCMGGMDNPVEVTFLSQGEMVGTVNLMYSRPRGDCLVNWQYGGAYPREDFAESLSAESIRTGPLLPEIHNFGHVAVSGLCRVRDMTSADTGGPETLLVTQFNTNRVSWVTLQEAGAGFTPSDIRDFAVSDNTDFHPTDVLQDADGSLLLIDTGGWFRIGCPQSQVEKSYLQGAIYRIRRTDSQSVADPRGNAVNWDALSPMELLSSLGDKRVAVCERAEELLAARLRGQWTEESAAAMSDWVMKQVPGVQLNWVRVLARVDSPLARQRMAVLTRADHPHVRQAAVRSLLYVDSATFTGNDQLYQSLLTEVRQATPTASRAALATLGRLFARRPGFVTDLLQAVDAIINTTAKDPLWRHALVYALIATGDREGVGASRFMANEATRLAVADALTELRRPRPDAATQVWLEIPAAGLGTPLSAADRSRLLNVAGSLAPGDPQKGYLIFKGERTSCVKCHRVGTEGGLVGPDLSTIGRSRSKADLLEAVLYPSASFARGFAPYLIASSEGRIFTGIVLAESNTHIRLGLNVEQSVSVPIGEIEEMRAADVSIMPSDVARQLTSEELADLIAYLDSLE
jgi:putative heme-binding domain-containing protein